MAKGKANQAMAAAVLGSPSKDNYQAESDFRTLTQAHALRNHKQRHAAALKHGKTMLKAHQGVIDDAEDNPAMGGDSGVDEASEQG